MVRKDHLDLNNIVERYPKRPRRSGGAGVGGIGDGMTPPFSNDIITPTDTNFNFNSLSANQVNGGEILSSSSSSAHHFNQYTATASTTTDTQQQQQQQQGCRGARRWVKVLRQPQCMLNEPYFGNNTKANFYVYTWIPITQLTTDERIQYEEKEIRIHQERMMWWNKNINSTPTTAAAVATTAKRRRSSSSSGSTSCTMKEDENVDEENAKANDKDEEEKIASTGQPSSLTTTDAAAAVENFEISTTTTSTPVQDTSAPASSTIS
jgi:hypothetical protein